MTREQFIAKIAPIIVKYAPEYNILCPSAVIAQAVLESDGGNSELATNAHNYFGLKYRVGRCPTACGIYYKVGSEQNKDGSYTSSEMQWMKFSNIDDGVKGYFDFINISNYSNLKGIKDPKEYLEKIKLDGYATSLNYVENVFRVIQNYNLTKYDVKEETKMSYKVAIDAGHGSDTAGKRTPDGYREHWINVDCANYFDIAMRRCGIETFKVSWDDEDATDDSDIALGTRQSQIKNAKCDISVSWHANAHGDGKTYTSGQGIETFVHSESNKVADSRKLANAVHKYLIQGTKQTNRGVKSNNFAMCNCSAMGTKASILIETAFMTNAYESELLKTDAFCLECAEEAAKGVCEYLGVTYKANNNSSTSTNITPNTTTTTSSYTLTQFIKDIQKAIGVSVDGIVGTQTLSKLPTVSKSKNNRHAVVKPLQKYLNALGYDCGTADGIAGAKFDTATKAWAKANGCTADGEFTAGGKSWKVILGYGSTSTSTNTTTSTATSSSSVNYTYKGVNYSLVFNPTYYSNKYPDLKKAFGTNATKLFEHFCEYGMQEKRQAIDNFNVDVYKNTYVDLRNAFGDDMPKYYEHWIKYGVKEGRKAK